MAQVEDRDAPIGDHATGEPLPLAQDAEQEVLVRDLAVAESDRLAERQLECLLGPRAERYVDSFTRLGPVAPLPSPRPPPVPVRCGRLGIRELRAGGGEDGVEVDADRGQRAPVRVSP